MKIKIVYLLIVSILAAIGVLTLSSRNEENTQNLKTINKITDDSLLTLVEYNTFQYFYDGAEPFSGMTRERYNINDIYPENDKNVVTSGGTGFGVMAILVGIERKFITREEGLIRLQRIVTFLGKAERFHGAWPHWLYGETGKVKPFSPEDDGADLVETAYLAQGLLAVRQYFKDGTKEEKSLSAEIDKLWRGIEWNWFTKGDEKVIYWHWSPDNGWKMNFPVKGYNECLILYVLAASSPTYPVDPEAYHQGWARNGEIISKKNAFGIPLILKHNFAEEFGGPLFWAHYSYLGLNPKGLSDRYADYWQLNVNQALINHQWCSLNPKHYKGYSSDRWGLSASYSPNGYAAHAPGEKTDFGVISPTAAISSFPYTPAESMAALKDFYYNLGNKIFGKYGFYDAFSEQFGWFPKCYLAIDQGPEIIMIENYRTGLIWRLFMSCPEVRNGLNNLSYNTPVQ